MKNENDNNAVLPLPIRRCALLTFANPNYVGPTSSDVRSILKQLDLRGREVASICGVNGRTVRKWMAHDGPHMPYGAWRLLVLHATWTEVTLVQTTAENCDLCGNVWESCSCKI